MKSFLFNLFKFENKTYPEYECMASWKMSVILWICSFFLVPVAHFLDVLRVHMMSWVKYHLKRNDIVRERNRLTTERLARIASWE